MKPAPELQASAGHSRADILGRVADEYYSALDRGERPDVEEFASQYPEVADAIRQVLPALSLLDESDCADIGFEKQGEERAKSPKRLGDFRIGRELGRGGMGVVYEAEQISMGRTVALKILPFAAVMDEKAITRFKNEARAAGTLHHDNIVPIHAVGNERGVYYYAMSLIRGMTMAQIIEELRERVAADPRQNSDSLLVDQVIADQSARRVDEASRSSSPDDPTVDSVEGPPGTGNNAEQETRRLVEGALTTQRSLFDKRFFQQVARIGIEAAEALDHAHEHGIVHRDIKPANLIVDPTGKLWVTDFGLARIESDAGMTMTGDLLGTLRYMAPEQALAKRIVVDHRADIYSLGVTLYELITLRPAFDGADRESLLKQLTFEEPKRPRHFHPGVPQDLETIVLKAIAKNPDERYDSARELAEDLRAFNENKPIKAKPLNVFQQGRKWARRHQGFVAAAAVVLLVSTLALAGTAILIANEQSQTEAALESAQVNLEEADRQKQRAEENFKRAREAVDTYLTRVSEDLLLNEPGLQPLRRDLLELALDYYEQFVEQRDKDPLLQLAHADALDRVAKIRKMLGADQQFVNDLRSQALDIRKGLFEKDPNNAEYRNALAESYLLSEEEAGHEGELKVARLEKAIELARPLTEPKHRLTLARGYKELGDTLGDVFRGYGRIENMERSREQLEKAITIFEELEDQNVVDGPFLFLPEAYQAMASWHNELRHVDETKRFDQQALEQLQRLEAAHPKNVDVLQALAKSYKWAGDDDRFIDILETLAKDNPLVPGFRIKVARAHWGDETSLEILKRLVAEYPEREDFRSELGTGHVKLAETLLEDGRLDEAIENAESAIAILTETGTYPGELATAYFYLSRAHDRAGRWNEAIKALESNRQVASELSENQLHFRTSEVSRRAELAGLLRKVGRIEEAIVEYELACFGLEDNLAVEKVDGTPLQITRARIAMAHHLKKFAIFLHEIQRDDRFSVALEKAISNLEPLFDEEATAYFAVVTSSELLEAVSGRASNQEPIAKLRRLVQQNLEAELRDTRSRLKPVGDDGPDMEWKRWSGLAFRGYAGLNWQGAEKEAHRAIEHGQNDPDYLLGMAPLLLLTGEDEEYRQLCLKLLDAPDVESPERQASIDNWTARLCGLDPKAAGAAERVLALAERGMTPPNEERHYFIYSLGRAYYRAGQYEKAVETLRRALSQNIESAEPLICMDLALAYHYWGRKQEAQEWYGRGSELLNDKGLTKKLWHELAETVVLYHEAKQLLTGMR